MFIAIAISILLFAIAMGFAFSGKGKQSATFEERLRAMARDPEKIDLTDLELSKPFSERVIQPIFERLGKLISAITPAEVIRETKRKILQSGLKIKATTFVAMQIILAVAIPAMLGLMGTVSNVGGLRGVGMLIISGVIGYFLPDVWLKSRVSARKAEVTRGLPDALDLLTVAVEAGLGFDMALTKLVEKSKGPVSQEFGRVLHEVRMGKPRREAMRDMAERVDAPDLSQFISALVQADKLGVSIANVLRIQSDQMRLKRRQRAEETAMKAPLKMSFVLVFFVLPALLIVLLGPAGIAVIEQLSGNESL